MYPNYSRLPRRRLSSRCAVESPTENQHSWIQSLTISPFESDRIASGRVGSGRVGSGRVGSGRVGSGRVGSGRVGSGRVGSGRVGSGRGRVESSPSRDFIDF